MNGAPTSVRQLLQEVGLLRRHTGPLRPGLYFLTRWHDPDCRRPQGGACTCAAGGPDVTVERFRRPEACA